jgi:predicted DNA-binding transcriptional regulator YafY
VDPYGLVAKAGAWYLVCAADGRMRVYRVAELLDAQRAGETFGRPETFDLAAYWRGWCAERESYRSLYPVTVRVAADFVPELVRRLGPGVRRRIEAAGPPDDEGRLTLELRFQTLEQARERILPMGRGVEVLEPWALRRSVQDMAEQIVMLYGGG